MNPSERRAPDEIDPTDGPEYREPTWQEARDQLAEVIEYDSGSEADTFGTAVPDGDVVRRVLAVRDDDAVLVDLGLGTDGGRMSVVVDTAARALLGGGKLHDVLATDWWDPADGTTEDYPVARWLLTSIPKDPNGWESWLADAISRPKDPSDCPVPIPPPGTHPPARTFG